MADSSYEPKKVSTRKGGTKKGGQTYKNVYAFHANKGSKLTKSIANMPISGLCGKCVDVIEWRKKFKKYKPLTTMKKCVNCQQKAIKDAYHVICTKCAHDKNVCAKCLESKEIVPTNIKTEKEIVEEQVKLERLLGSMSERERRSYMRKLERKKAAGEDVEIESVGDEDSDDDLDSDSDDSDDDEDEDEDEDEDDQKK